MLLLGQCATPVPQRPSRAISCGSGHTGLIGNPDLQDYLIPTIADAPQVLAEFVEVPQPGMPFGWKGAGELPLCAALPAIAAAVRDATGLPLPAAPIRPEHIALRQGAAPIVTWTTAPPPPPRLPTRIRPAPAAAHGRKPARTEPERSRSPSRRPAPGSRAAVRRSPRW
jgi:hypothetical protein